MILYGSCARGDFKDYSDVDIALLIKGGRTDSSKPYKGSDYHDLLEYTLKLKTGEAA